MAAGLPRRPDSFQSIKNLHWRKASTWDELAIKGLGASWGIKDSWGFLLSSFGGRAKPKRMTAAMQYLGQYKNCWLLTFGLVEHLGWWLVGLLGRRLDVKQLSPVP